MNATNSDYTLDIDTCCEQVTKVRHSIQGNEPHIFTDIYREDVNMAIWKRPLSSTLSDSVSIFLTEKPRFKASMTVSSQSVLKSISESSNSVKTLQSWWRCFVVCLNLSVLDCV